MTKQQLIAAILDAIGAILAIWIGSLVEQRIAEMIIATWVAIQVPLLGILALVSYDTKARLEASSRDLETLSKVEPGVRQSLLAEFYEDPQAKKK